jgi:hypothetical protein
MAFVCFIIVLVAGAVPSWFCPVFLNADVAISKVSGNKINLLHLLADLHSFTPPLHQHLHAAVEICSIPPNFHHHRPLSSPNSSL